MPLYCERTIAALPRIYINGGARGFLVGMNGADLMSVLKPELVSVAIS
jgi:prolyl-tRNA editing enzyme YbaK/EbsC (Cys-tRNA(Pro) deacylase)